MARDDTRTDSAKPVGVIDIGSNSLRMVVAQVFPDGRTEVLERALRPVRLGHSTFVTGRLSQDAMNAAITILRDYRQILDGYRVEVVRAVATSAVREAANRDAFIDRIARAVGLDVSVIEPTEESMLIVSAVRHAVGNHLDLRRHVTLLAEVGGGSTLLTVLRNGEIAASASYSLGSIRIQEILSLAHEPPERAADLMDHRIANAVELAKKSMDLKAARTFLAIGGDARFAAQAVGKKVSHAELSAVGAAELDGLLGECAPHAVEELTRTYGLAFAEAETLVPALLIYRALLRATSADRMMVSQVSMRDGLLLDLPRYITGQEDPALTESIILSAKTMGAKYRYDVKHAEHVADLAARLFDALQKEHRLKRRYRLLLRVAALLHDVGEFVSNRAHHKHTYYLISNTEIFGLRRDELAIVAHVARYHRRSVPKASHLDYMALPREERMLINKLAAVLRVADALDRGHWQQVRDFDIERRGRDLVIYVKGAVELTLERLAMIDKGDLFEEMFGVKVRLEEEAAAVPPDRRGHSAFS